MSGATLRMGAFRAALAFARRRMVRRARRRRMPWTPIALRWRRAVAVAMRAPSANPARNQLVERSTRRVQMQVRVDLWTTTRGAMRQEDKPSLEPARARHVASAVLQPPRRLIGQASTVSKIATKPSDVARAATRHPSMPFPPSMVTAHVAAWRQAPMATTQRALRWSDSPISARAEGVPAAVRALARLSFPHQHPSAPQARHPDAGHPRSAIDAIATRSPALVWRTREPTRAESPDAPHAQDIRSPTARPVPEQQAESRAVPDVQSALSIQQPDPAFVDRLADDVIRRIDRRLRIERERRGL